MKKVIVILLLFLPVLSLFSQEKKNPPVSIETLFGNERVAMTIGMNRLIEGKFRYMGVLSTAANYDYKKGATELVSVNSFAYQLKPYLAASTGIQYHFVKGFIPNLALHYNYANPEWLLMLAPYYNFLPWNGLETLAVVEYKPQLTDRYRLFTRFQGFYGHNLDTGKWERGMLYFRLGLQRKQYNFGLGSNFDFYQNKISKTEKQNFGGFVTFNL